MFNRFFDCAEDCDDAIIPVLKSDPDCEVFDLFGSQIKSIVFVPISLIVTDWTSPTVWENIVDNTDTTNLKARKLDVVGNLGTPEKIKTGLPKSERVWKRKHTVQANTNNLTGANYDFLRSLQCSDIDYNFWFETVGGHFFGGTSGIVPELTECDLPLEGGSDEVEYASIAIDFYASTAPNRISSPFVIIPNLGLEGISYWAIETEFEVQ